jgi:hypothetical protein
MKFSQGSENIRRRIQLDRAMRGCSFSFSTKRIQGIILYAKAFCITVSSLFA